MKPNHMRVHAFGIYQMSADLAGHVASQIGNRLLQQGLSSSLSAPSAFTPDLLAFGLFPTQ